MCDLSGSRTPSKYLYLQDLAVNTDVRRTIIVVIEIIPQTRLYLEFRGSNRYPRSFGRVVRVAVDLGLEPVFNPPGEPWRNGGVERHNSFLHDRLFTIECADLAALRQQAHICQTACNHTHRLATLNGLTPDEVAAKAILHFTPTGYNRHQLRSLPQNKGFVSFISSPFYCR